MKKQINIRERLLKDGTVKYYAGNRNLTHDEKKTFFKSQIKSAGFQPERLSADDRKLFGRIKGGVAATSRAVRLDDGRIIKRDIGKAAKKLGVDLDAGLKATGYKTLRELEENKPEFFKAINNYLNSGTVSNWHRVDSMKENISDFRGSTIILNGEKVSKSTAKNELSKFNTELLQKLGSDAYQVTTRMQIKGSDVLEFSLPDLDDLDDEINIFEFNEMFGDNDTGSVRVYGSPTPKK